MIVWWWSRIVFFNEFEVLVKRNSSTVISINLLEIPFNHFFSDGQLERLECIFHQSSEFVDINEIIFTLIVRFLGLLCSLSKEVSDLNKKMPYVFFKGDFSIFVIIDSVEMPSKLILCDIFFVNSKIISKKSS